ncbi:MAG: HlyD family secretion protein [Verrucomicrobiota bacterium]
MKAAAKKILQEKTQAMEAGVRRFKAEHAALFLGSIVALCVLILCGFVFFILSWNKIDLQGYIEGEFVYVASPVGGRLEKLFVKRGETVSANQPLFALDPQVETQAQAEAAARLRDAEAAFQLAQSNFTRTKLLLEQNVISQREYDEAERTFKSAEQVAAAWKESLAQAQWKVTEKQQVARSNALVHDTYYTEGEWVAAGKPVVALLPPENMKVKFFVPESMLGKLQVGQELRISSSGLGKPAYGTVSYISTQAEYTPPVIYSIESRSKLVFLVEGSFLPDEAQRLHPGQPVDVRVTAD